MVLALMFTNEVNNWSSWNRKYTIWKKGQASSVINQYHMPSVAFNTYFVRACSDVLHLVPNKVTMFKITVLLKLLLNFICWIMSSLAQYELSWMLPLSISLWRQSLTQLGHVIHLWFFHCWMTFVLLCFLSVIFLLWIFFVLNCFSILSSRKLLKLRHLIRSL